MSIWGEGFHLTLRASQPGIYTHFRKQHSHFKTERHQRVQQLLPAQTWAVVQSLGPTKAQCCLNRSCMASGLGPALTALPVQCHGDQLTCAPSMPQGGPGCLSSGQKALSIPHCGHTQKEALHSALSSSIRQCQGRANIHQCLRRVFLLAKTHLVPGAKNQL